MAGKCNLVAILRASFSGAEAILIEWACPRDNGSKEEAEEDRSTCTELHQSHFILSLVHIEGSIEL